MGIIKKRSDSRKRWVVVVYGILFSLVLSTIILAHEAEEVDDHDEPVSIENNEGWSQKVQNVIQQRNDLNIKFLTTAAAIAVVLVIASIKYEKRIQKFKKLVFLGIVIPLILASLFLAATTIYANILSTTKGPVHWHADYEVWACNEKLDLVNPKGMSNRIGTALFHEHGNDRIHIEGVVHSLDDVTLGRYFTTIGGKLQQDKLMYQTEKGIIVYSNGDPCPNGDRGTLKVYVNGKKIANPEQYVITQTAYVPPGDCIIIDFSSSDAVTTDKICSSWTAKGWTYQGEQHGS